LLIKINRYAEFCEILKPKDTTYARLLTNRKPTYVEREDLSEVIENIE